MKSSEKYAEVVSKLEGLGVFPDRPPALDSTRRALVASGLMERIDPNRVIVVAGTNGKGSTCAALEALLLHAGQKVGLSTSPHLVQTTERIRIRGLDIAQEEFVRHYEELSRIIEKEKLTHFEAITLIAVRALDEAKLDWWILEVGLGGLWDATNAVPHLHSVICPIDFDHQNLLGNTLVEIAKNKFGIIPPRGRVVHAPFPRELRTLVLQTESELACQWVPQREFQYRVETGRVDGARYFIKVGDHEVALSLLGLRGVENSSLALTAFEELGFSVSENISALSQVRWPGRMERIDWPGSSCSVYLSGDHNPQGVRSLIEILRHFSYENLHLIVGVGRDKDTDGIFEKLLSLPGAVLYLTETPFKGTPIEGYGKWQEQARYSSKDPIEVMNHVALKAKPQDLIVVTGSLYLVGKVKEGQA